MTLAATAYKVNAIPERYVSIYQAQIGLVNKSRGEQCMLLAVWAKTSAASLRVESQAAGQD